MYIDPACLILIGLGLMISGLAGAIKSFYDLFC